MIALGCPARYGRSPGSSGPASGTTGPATTCLHRGAARSSSGQHHLFPAVDGKQRKYIPGYLLLGDDGPVVVDVKPRARLDEPRSRSHSTGLGKLSRHGARLEARIRQRDDELAAALGELHRRATRHRAQS